MQSNFLLLLETIAKRKNTREQYQFEENFLKKQDKKVEMEKSLLPVLIKLKESLLSSLPAHRFFDGNFSQWQKLFRSSLAYNMP